MSIYLSFAYANWRVLYISQVYLGHHKFPELTKLKKFVVNVHILEDMSVLGCIHVIGAAPLLEEFELKVSVCQIDYFEFWWKKLVLLVLQYFNSVTSQIKLG